MTATLIEGFNALEREGRLHYVAAQRSNYAPRANVLPRWKILREARSFDVVLLGTNTGVDRSLFEVTRDRAYSVCIDGADESSFVYEPSGFSLYFKRELPLNSAAPSNVLPCPFAVEKRFLNTGPMTARSTHFSAAFGPRPGERADTLAYLEGLALPSAHIGAVPGPWWMLLDGVARQQCGLRALLHCRFAVGHSPSYARLLRQSSLSLSVPGKGWDTARYWEILGSGAVLVSRPAAIQMPWPLVPGEHFLSYGSLEELGDLLTRARRDPAAIEHVRRQAHEFVVAHHTTRARAAYVLDAISSRAHARV